MKFWHHRLFCFSRSTVSRILDEPCPVLLGEVLRISAVATCKYEVEVSVIESNIGETFSDIILKVGLRLHKL